MNKERFKEACQNVIGKDRVPGGIGTLGEKTLHAVLKNYFEPYNENHEVKIGGFVVDIVGADGIIEIQTGNFDKLRKKLKTLLPITKVTIVYPIAKTKWLVWIDETTGSVTDKRKSPKKGLPYDVFFELYKIKPLLKNENLNICVVMLDIIEYRNLDGWSDDKKRGASRNERIPVDITEQIYIKGCSDYIKLIPNDLPEKFTAKDFKKASNLSLSASQTALNILTFIGTVKRIGKNGNTFIYELQ